MLHLFRLRRGILRGLALALLSKKPMSGMELIREIEELSMGAWRPSPGTIYPLLRRLEGEGLVESGEKEGRRIYRLTSNGERLARNYLFMIPVNTVEEALNIIEAYVDYLYDASSIAPLSPENRERVRSIARRLAALGEEQ